MKVAALLLGLVMFVGLLVLYVVSRDGPSPTRRIESDAGLAAAIEDLSRRLDVLERAPVLPSEPAPGNPMATGEDDRVAGLEARIARLEAQVGELRQDEALDTSAMTDDELSTACSAAYGRRDYKVAVRLAKALLERELDPEKRSDTLSMLGYAYRMLGDRENELATFRKLVTLEGENTQRGLNAVFAVGWTLASQENYEDGRRMMEKVIAGRESHPNMRKWARYWAANYAAKLGDYGRARELVDGIIEEYRDAVDQNDRMVYQYAERLKAEMN